MNDDPHTATNLAWWNERVPVHAASTLYDLDGYVTDPSRRSGVVTHDAALVGDVAGARLVHLQCHIGTDTLSWARSGAGVTGLDFSEPALAVARDLFERCATPGRFVAGTVDDAPTLLGATYDVVYASVGALNWLPDIAAWARTVAALLAPGGRLFVRDCHPVLFTLDDTRDDDLLTPFCPYFETAEALTWSDTGTYADDTAGLAHGETAEWNHGLAETVMAVLDAGLELVHLAEYTEIEWKALDHLVDAGDGRWRLPDHQHGFVPLMFSILARAPA